MYVEVNGKQNGDIARISSPLVSVSQKTTKCLKFWYHMYGPHIASLNVYANTTSLGFPIWSKNGTQGNKWKLAKVDVVMSQSYSLVFEGTAEGNDKGDIALDDIQLATGSCDYSGDPCNFQDDDCSFTQDNTDNFDWIRTKGSTPTPGTGPTVDHSYGSRLGYYMLLEASGQSNGDKARIMRTYKKATVTESCFQFWYMMYGSSLGTLNVYQKVGNNLGNAIWTVSGDQGVQRTWLKGRVTLNSTAQFTVVFEGVRGSGAKSDIAIDDISMSSGHCPNPGDCNFQNDFCTWSNMAGDDFNWIRGSGQTPSFFTGPDTDRLGSSQGAYAFIETSSPRKQGDKARLVSTQFNGTASKNCFTFWYHMYGSSIGTLNLYQVVGNTETLIWTLSGNKGRQWFNGQVPVGNQAKYKIIAEGIRGTSYQGDIAIDDFRFLPGINCQLSPTAAAPNYVTTAAPTTSSATTTPIPNGGINCDFESDICTWTQDKTDQFDWTRRAGSTASSSTGPSADHTKGNGNGWYVYIETSWPRKMNDTARLISSSIPGTTASKGKCLSFWYHMYGADINTLSVYVRTGAHDSMLWSKTGTRGDKWIQGRATVTSRDHFKIVMSASVGNSYQGDIALDDISMTDGPCNHDSTTCTFEESHMCGYQQDTTDDFDWARGSGATVTPNTGPAADHTLGSASGFYMYIDSSIAQSGKKARLLTPQMPKVSAKCLKFWYHMYGSTVGTLAVYKKTGSLVGIRIWRRSGDQGDEWLVAQVSVWSPVKPFWLSFEGQVAGSTGDIAIDDVEIFAGKCPTPGNCDFEKGTCTWRNTRKGDDFDWLQGKGNTLSSTTGPSNDHTTNSANGTYMFIEASSPRKTGDKARFFSETLSAVPAKGMCLQFWYHMYGLDIGTLNVVQKTTSGSKSENILWTLQGQQGNKWLNGKVSLSKVPSSDFWIIFEGIRGTGYRGDIAIDDILITSGDCTTFPANADPNPVTTSMPTATTQFTLPPTIAPSLYNCDFESGFCNYTQEHITDIFNWTRHQGGTYSGGTGPTADHTKQQGVVGPNGPGSLQHKLSAKCIHVYLGGFSKPNPGTVIVTYDGCGESRLEFQLTSDGYIKYTKYNMCLRRRGGSGVNADDVMLDDKCNEKWKFTSKGSIQHLPTSKCWTPYGGKAVNDGKLLLNTTCDNKDQQFRWQPTRGWYVYIEGSFPRKPSDTARIHSPYVNTNPSQPKCLSFWYHMYGPHIGQLNIYRYAGGQLNSPVWSKSGSHGNKWLNGQVELTNNNPYKIVFEGVRGSSYQSDIALDDIQLSNGQCTATMDCDFESPVSKLRLCGWNQYPGANINWRLGQGNTSSINTGPASDHTLRDGRGHYLFIETSFVAPNSKAWLIGPKINPQSGKCFQFWYHMYGSSIGQLNVYLMTTKTVPSIPAWSRQRDQGNLWYIAQVSITIPNYVNVLFEGVRGTSYTGDIAIDDFKLMDGPCNQAGYCDFEKDDWCTWTNDKREDNFDWLVGSGSTPSAFTGPAVDHTTGHGIGKYMFMEASAPTRPGDKARLYSERFQPTGGSCIKFWYHMYGPSVGTLNVLVKTGAGNRSEDIVWTLSGNQLDQWKFGQAPVVSAQSGYQVVFEAIRGSDYRGDIAIDDIAFTVGACTVLPHNAKPTPPPTPPATTGPTTIPPKGKFDCDFEGGFCLWTQDSTDSFNWTRHRGRTSSTDTGPTTDHTLKTGNGTYAYAEASYPRQLNDTARLISPTLQSNTRPGTCISFWYHMYGADINSLNVYTKVGGSLGTAIWQKKGNQANAWKYGQVFVRQPLNYQVVFEAVRGKNYLGDISLDDIAVKDGFCPPLKECAFEETGLCGWSDEKSVDNFDWTRQSGSTSSSGTGPTFDHTLGTAKGFYMFIETSSPRKTGDKAQLLSPRYGATNGKCLQFWYHMYGRSIGTLNVRIRRLVQGKPTYFLQWSRSGDHGNRWRVAQVTVSSVSDYQIVFEGVAGSSYQGDIAIDDVVLLDNACPLPGDCNFETGMCTWVNVAQKDDFDWVRYNGDTRTLGTGPSTDHTTKTKGGYYMYIETSSPRLLNHKARMESEEFQPTGASGRCLKFWYHMYGASIGSLNVWISSNGSSGQIWTLTGNKGNKWQFAQAPVSSKSVYQVIFEGVRGQGHQGDIAIDDVQFTVGWCVVLPPGARPLNPWTTPAVTTSPPITAPTSAPSIYDCTFENNTCTWTQALDDTFNWTRHQGSTLSRFTGPSTDHTTGGATGFYMYIETSYPRKPNDTARFESAMVPATQQKCLQFWYHMYGPHVDTLNVYTKVNQQLGSPVWTRSGTQGNKWKHATLSLTVSSKFKVVFEGRRGSSWAGDIALDDISMQDGQCPPQTQCSFEDQKLCGWKNINGDNFDWTRANGLTASLGTGPSLDHTTGTANGYYLYIETSSPRSKGHKAWLVSPQFKSTNGRCLQFWYHMYGSTIGTLNVLLLQNKTRSSPIWSLSSNQGDIWRVAQVTLNSAVDFSVIFEGITGTSYTGDIAIDDVEITDGACPLPGDCDFEKGMCTWVNSPNVLEDEFDWTRGSGGTPSQFTGPKIDHTTGSAKGNYLFIETSLPRRRGDRARLESEVFPATPSNGRCMQFWYHMNGSHIGTLNVYMRVYGQSETKLWSLSGDQGTAWKAARLQILSGGRHYQIIFEGIRGVDYQGDIAIDDITFTTTVGKCITSPVSAVPFDCNFENGICSWSQSITDRFDWTRHRGSTGSVLTGPSIDHTTGTSQGWYVYIETSFPRQVNDTARILSPTIKADGSQKSIHCVSFWYHMYGPHVDTLRLYQKVGSTLGKPKWVRQGDQGNQWIQGEYTVEHTKDVQIVFEAVRGVSYRGDIALDDISLKDGSCPSSGMCSFEAADICGYQNSYDTTDKFNWLRSNGPTTSIGTGPVADHTYGTVYGHYMYTEVSPLNLNAGDTAHLRSPRYPATQGSCLQFWYHMYGRTIGTLNVYVETFSIFKSKVWSKTGNDSNIWNVAQVNIKSRSGYQIVFEGVKGASYTGDIAIDDVKIMNGSCPSPGDCSFDDGMCTWTNARTGDTFDWIVGGGRTPSFLTGPSKDHTTGSGQYMFIETSSPRVPGDKAYLLSEPFDPTSSSGRCLQFWHHMKGASIGTLNVYIYTGNFSTMSLLWQRIGNKGDNWLLGQTPIRSSVKYQVLFEGIRGNSYTGDIALDDVSFTVGAANCRLQPYDALPVNMTTAAPPVTTSPSITPTTIGNQGNDCNFEVGICSWTFDSNGKFNWTRHQGSTASSGTGPKYDHTLGNTGQGYYMYIETSSPRQPNDTAGLVSPIIPTSGPTACVLFWYHMFGPHIASLNVYVKDGNNPKTLTWQKVGSQADEWKQGLVQFNTTQRSYQVTFEGVRGSSYQGDISLDDISFQNNNCPAASECTFEAFVGSLSHTCGWTQDTTDDFQWTRASGSTASYQTGPAFDHTYGTSQGYYMYIETSYPRKQGDKARLISPTYPAVKGGQCFQFWYHMYGQDIGTLNVYVKSPSGKPGVPVWLRSGDRGNIWKIAQVAVTSSSNFQIVVEGVAGKSYQGDIAVDDMKLIKSPCPLPGDCDFESGMCTYTNTPTEDQFDWLRNAGATPSWRTGPKVDHTLGTGLGHYMYIETSSPRRQGDKARLVSEDFSPVTIHGRCVKFWYHMYGASIGALRILEKTGPGNKSESVIWELSGNFGDQWYSGQAPITSGSPYQVVFEAVRGSSVSGDIAIDDITFSTSKCSVVPSLAMPPTPPPTKPPPIINNCTFEGGFCSWKNLNGDDFDWTRSRGSTASWSTGPTVDHTKGTSQGYYVYIETSSPRRQNDKAQLQSGLIQPTTVTSGRCLKFWFHMWGKHVDTLNVYRKDSSSQVRIWTRRGTQGNKWRYAQVNLISNQPFYVIFEGVRGSSYMGDIALDDLDVADGPCPPPKACDFETDMCLWKNTVGDDFNWQRDSGGTPSLGTGPSSDHTTGTSNGYYMYIETSSPRQQGDVAFLISPKYTGAQNGKCLNFWYHMAGPHIGQLNVYVKTFGSPSKGSKVWNETGDQGNFWLYARAPVKISGDFQILFEGIRGQSYKGDIAIDDLSIDDSPCPPEG
ncbi:unnamed protein product [Pocillopora meandrina]|uniref:MAM domain-containing protein n=1 Tax=Pocillopora meandrina TaxID=46732 RepID=A0AAU9WLR3_9CNID|nr:unnamed protein product [Pocillopora meandrina]